MTDAGKWFQQKGFTRLPWSSGHATPDDVENDDPMAGGEPDWLTRLDGVQTLAERIAGGPGLAHGQLVGLRDLAAVLAGGAWGDQSGTDLETELAGVPRLKGYRFPDGSLVVHEPNVSYDAVGPDGTSLWMPDELPWTYLPEDFWSDHRVQQALLATESTEALELASRRGTVSSVELLRHHSRMVREWAVLHRV